MALMGNCWVTDSRMKRLGPYSRRPALAELDMRSKAGWLLRRTRASLTAHLGGKPSATQAVLIERASMLTVQLALMDAKHLAGVTTEHDARQHLAWNNALTRLMRQLGLKGPAERPRTLAEIHASREAARTAA